MLHHHSTMCTAEATTAAAVTTAAITTGAAVSLIQAGDGDEDGGGSRGRQRPAPELEDTGVVGERAMGKGE